MPGTFARYLRLLTARLAIVTSVPLMTFLAVELDRLALPTTAELVCVLARDAGASRARTPRSLRDDNMVVVAAFPVAIDAVRAAINVAHTLVAGDVTSAFRVCLSTSHVDGAEPETDSWSGAQPVKQLAGSLDRQILVSASTAVLVDSALPSGVDLVAHRRHSFVAATIGHERLYELRPAGPVADSDDGQTFGSTPHQGRSNLGWARRAAPGLLVGREEPAAVLRAAWYETLSGRRRSVLLVGDAGIGKTAAAAELALRAHADGARVLYGRWDVDGTTPYQAIREALIIPADHCDDQMLAETAVHRLDHFSARRPVLVVLDDLHLAEPASLRLVDELRAAPSAAPWTVVATAHESDQGPAGQPAVVPSRRAFVGDPLTARTVLGGLDAPAISRLVEWTVGCCLEPDHEAVHWLTSETAGNPLLLQAILQGVRGTRDPAAALLASRARLPSALAKVIEWRLSRLPSQTRRLLTDAARFGPMVDVENLAADVCTPPAVVRAAMEPAVAQDLLRRDPISKDFSFAHEVVRRFLHNEATSQPRPASDTTVHRPRWHAPSLASHVASPGFPSQEVLTA
jgi:hypothetical protein